MGDYGCWHDNSLLHKTSPAHTAYQMILSTAWLFQVSTKTIKMWVWFQEDFSFFQKTNKTHRIVVKTNSFVRFLEEFMAWQFPFKINWPSRWLVFFLTGIIFADTTITYYIRTKSSAHYWFFYDQQDYFKSQTKAHWLYCKLG